MHEGDIFYRKGRHHTKAFVYPPDGQDYVALTPTFFKNHICPSIGEILDFYVGRCGPNDSDYNPVIAADEVRN